VHEETLPMNITYIVYSHHKNASFALEKLRENKEI
jgi:hypothetical protein